MTPSEKELILGFIMKKHYYSRLLDAAASSFEQLFYFIHF